MTLDTPPSEDLIIDVVTKIFKDHKVKPTIQIEPGSNVGDGFLGITGLVTVKFDDKEQSFFIKMAAQDSKVRKVLSQRKFFIREAYFYDNIQPVLNNLCLRYMHREFGAISKAFYTSVEDNNECIVLKNLSRDNYSITKAQQLDKEHLLMVLKAYSELHACGFIVKKQHPEVFERFLVTTSSDIGMHVKHFDMFGLNKMASSCLDICKRYLSLTDNEVLLNHIESIRSKVINSASALEVQEDYSTIIHVDCWRNNIMFKYSKDKSSLEDLKLIDLQMWTINSPTLDLVHTIYSNASSKDILDNLYFYLDFYYSSLSKIIVEMGENPEILYPREIFLRQWKKHCIYGLWMSLVVIRGLMATPELLPNLVEYIQQNKRLDEFFVFDLPDEAEYSKRIEVILNHFVKNKYV